MLLKVFAVYDAAVQAFLQPFMARSPGEATRMFIESIVANPQFAKHRKDYSLWELSEFNDVTGEYGVPKEERLSYPKSVMTGVEAMALAEKQIPLPFNGAQAPVDLSDEAQVGPADC